MPKYELGDIRRSQILHRGPGAIIDFRAGEKGGGPVSIITSGLEQWEKRNKLLMPMSRDPNVISEPRLEAKLAKTHFRMPPVQVVEGNDNEDGYKPHIEGIRFPKWLQCTSCDLLDQAHRFESEIGDPSRWCAKCSAKQGKRVHVFPVRFITMCENGHISDFQWSYYYSRLKNCSCGSTKIYLKSDGNSSALESLFLTCNSDKCKDNKVSLKHIFDSKFLSTLGIKCLGERPWIGDSEDCSCTITTAQRGASNTYFPKIESALSIPPWDNPLKTKFRLGFIRIST